MSARATRCGLTPDRMRACTPARVGRAARSATGGAAMSLSKYGYPGCPGTPWRYVHVLASEPQRGAVARRTVRRDGLVHAPNPATRHASQPSQSRTAFHYSQELQPDAVDDGPWDSTRASGLDAGQSPLRLAGRRRPVAVDAPTTASRLRPRHASQDQATVHQSVEVRARPQPPRAPPPSSVFYP